jgi:hypothetical protein
MWNCTKKPLIAEELMIYIATYKLTLQNEPDILAYMSRSGTSTSTIELIFLSQEITNNIINC